MNDYYVPAQRENSVDKNMESSVQETPIFLLGKGKICPQNHLIQNEQIIKPSEENSEHLNEVERSDSHNTLKLTKKTRTYIAKRKSITSELDEVVGNLDDLEMPEIANNLE